MHIAKKGESMSITVVIVAAIALIVLVVLVAIFTGRMGGFNKDVSNQGDSDRVIGGSASRGGICTALTGKDAAETITGKCGIGCPDTAVDESGETYASESKVGKGYSKDTPDEQKCSFGLFCCIPA